MTTMFSGNQQKSVPKSFEECYKKDNVSTNLWQWGERIEKLGRIFFFILIIAGPVISAVIGAYDEEYGEFDWDDFNFGAYFLTLLSYALYAFIEYCVYHVLALLFCSLASIVQNNNITANIALYNSKDYNIKNNSNNKAFADYNVKNDVDNKTSVKVMKPVPEKEIGTCQMCNATNVEIVEYKIKDDLGTRYRKICFDCLEKVKK